MTQEVSVGGDLIKPEDLVEPLINQQEDVAFRFSLVDLDDVRKHKWSLVRGRVVNECGDTFEKVIGHPELNSADPLDKRRQSLERVRTVSSGYKGVSYIRSRARWRATHQGKFLGEFDTEGEAVAAKQRAATVPG